MSETALCRDRLSRFCKGVGVDLGFGGDPIVPTAITIDMNPGFNPNICGDARFLRRWFSPGALDYVYSSHLLEDFIPEQTEEILADWVDATGPGGFLVLYLPNETVYRRVCMEKGLEYNLNHKCPDMSLDYIKGIIAGLDERLVEIVYEKAHCEDYSFEIVLKVKW